MAGDSLAQLFDGTWKRVADVVKGDILVDALTRGPAVVRCVVRTRVLEPTLYSVGDVRATAWHPCKTPGGDRWSFPAEVTTGVDCDVAYVYSFLFEGGATGYLSVGGTAVIGLGHGIRNDSVASHPFFGTARVIDALKDCPGFSEGRVDLLDGAYVRAAGNRSSGHRPGPRRRADGAADRPHHDHGRRGAARRGQRVNAQLSHPLPTPRKRTSALLPTSVPKEERKLAYKSSRLAARDKGDIG